MNSSTPERRELMRGRFVCLRLTDEGDADDIVAWRNQPEATRWLYRWKPLTRDEHLAWFRRAPERGDLMITFVDSEGRAVGATSLYNWDAIDSQSEWGRLCAARIGGPRAIVEGCYLVNRLCFEALGFVRIHLLVAKENERAWRLYQFLGWQIEGTLRKHYTRPDGGYDDVYCMSVLPEEFTAARPKVERTLYGAGPAPELTPEQAVHIRAVAASRKGSTQGSVG